MPVRQLSLRLDVLPALALTAVALALSFAPEGEGGDTWVDSLFVAALTLPLLWRRHAPLACAAGVALGMVISGLPTFDQTRCAAALPAALLAIFALASRRGRRETALGFALLLGGLAFVAFTDPVVDDGPGGFLAVAGGLLALAAVAGSVTQVRQRLVVALRQRSRELEERRGQTARMAVEVERTRLADELGVAARTRVHEIVALAAAPGADPRDAFARIETMARATLNDMRGMLGVLRTDERRNADVRPTLEQLDALLAAAGRSIELRVDGEPRPLGEAIEVAAYRMVQHGLEAVGEATTVDLHYGSDGVEVEVAGAPDPGAGAKAAVAAASERAALCGGKVTVKDGGRRVFAAWLPAAATA